MKEQRLELKPWDRVNYPHLKSRAELRKMELMPAPGVSCAARVERPKKYGGNYFLYDMEKTVPLVLTPAQEERQDRKIKRAERIQASKDLLKKQREDAAAHLAALDLEKKHSIVVIDFETTGTYPEWDEILQVAIIDQDGNELMNELCSPVLKTKWKKAQGIHGISPDDVAGKKAFGELAPQVAEILLSAETVVAYNDPFEKGFLSWAGLDPDRFTWAPDPMVVFAELHNDGRWAKLINAAAFYGYQFNAHDALQDVRATLHLHKHLLEETLQLE